MHAALSWRRPTLFGWAVVTVLLRLALGNGGKALSSSPRARWDRATSVKTKNRGGTASQPDDHDSVDHCLILPLPMKYDESTGNPIYLKDPKCWPIFLNNMKFYTSELQLWNTFKNFGEVLEIKFFEDPENGMSLGKAILWFRDKESQKQAVSMNGVVLDGRAINVDLPTATSWRRLTES